jgi:hypothetical protein
MRGGPDVAMPDVGDQSYRLSGEEYHVSRVPNLISRIQSDGMVAGAQKCKSRWTSSRTTALYTSYSARARTQPHGI